MKDEDILRYFCGPKLKNIQRKKLENIPDDILEYINNRYNDSLSIRETILRIKLNIDIHPVCPYCNNPVRLHPYKSYFLPTCGDKECNRKEFNKNFKQTMLERYGYEYNFQNKDILKKSVELAHTPENIKKFVDTNRKRWGNDNYGNRKKAKQTKLERYGNEKYINVEKIKRTKLERYGDENYTNKEKAKITNLERYGVEYTFQSKIIQEKIKRTNLEKYGVDYLFKDKKIQEKIHNNLCEKYRSSWNLEKCKETWMNKFGVDNPFKSDNVKEKIKNTCLERYGANSWSSSEIGRKKISEIGFDNEIQNKKLITFKKNNSFKTSKPEEECYNLLKEKYPDTIRQYRSEEYPFNCDFYIPSIDTYIEYQGSDLHGFHPFNRNNIDDINRLNNLKERSYKIKKEKNRKKTRYDFSIYTWTDLDVRKRNIAKENHLNYLEFFSLNELKEWLKNQS